MMHHASHVKKKEKNESYRRFSQEIHYLQINDAPCIACKKNESYRRFSQDIHSSKIYIKLFFRKSEATIRPGDHLKLYEI